MKKIVIASLVVAMVLSVGLSFADKPEEGTTGNGAPKCKLLGKVNIIAVKNSKTDNMDGNGGAVIFVNEIGLVESGTEDAPGTEEGDFVVLDKNATDADGGLLALPAPGYDAYNTGDPGEANTVSKYSVLVRPLGAPGGKASITTCAELLDSDFAGLLSGKFVSTLNKDGYFGGYASVEQVGQDILTREKGKSTFTNVTAELTSIVFMVEVELADTSIIVEYIRVPIFDPIIQGEYWDYEQGDPGLKLCQVRFYDCPTDVSLSDGDWNNLPEEPE